MGKDCRSLFAPQQLNSLPLLPLTDSGQQETVSANKNGEIDMVSVNRVFPIYTQLPQSNDGREYKPHDRFNPWPLNQKSFRPSQKHYPDELFLGSLSEKHMEAAPPKAGAGCPQKRFLVFDQSGDKTTLIFRSDIGKPFQSATPCSPKRPGAYKGNREILSTKEDLNLDQRLIPGEEFDGNNVPDLESEMHEDTEELNALLYSDDESFSDDDDDEVTSAYHFPSTVSAHDNQEASARGTEGVGTFVGYNKKRKLLDDFRHESLALLNASNTVEWNKSSFEDENDAESCCANVGNSLSMEFLLPSSNKRLKKEKIFETVSLLRSIIPCGEGEDPILVLDKAISYLKTLKLKAKSLGLDVL